MVWRQLARTPASSSRSFAASIASFNLTKKNAPHQARSISRSRKEQRKTKVSAVAKDLASNHRVFITPKGEAAMAQNRASRIV